MHTEFESAVVEGGGDCDYDTRIERTDVAIRNLEEEKSKSGPCIDHDYTQIVSQASRKEKTECWSNKLHVPAKKLVELRKYNWNQSIDDGVESWYHLKDCYVVDDAGTMLDVVKTRKTKSFLYGELIPNPSDSKNKNLPAIYVEVIVKYYSLDFGLHAKDPNRGMWFIDDGGLFFRPDTFHPIYESFTHCTMNLCRELLNFSNVVLHSAGCSERIAVFNERSVKYECDFTIDEICQKCASDSLNLEILIDNSLFYFNVLANVMNKSCALMKSLKMIKTLQSKVGQHTLERTKNLPKIFRYIEIKQLHNSITLEEQKIALDDQNQCLLHSDKNSTTKEIPKFVQHDSCGENPNNEKKIVASVTLNSQGKMKQKKISDADCKIVHEKYSDRNMLLHKKGRELSETFRDQINKCRLSTLSGSTLSRNSSQSSMQATIHNPRMDNKIISNKPISKKGAYLSSVFSTSYSTSSRPVNAAMLLKLPPSDECEQQIEYDIEPKIELDNFDEKGDVINANSSFIEENSKSSAVKVSSSPVQFEPIILPSTQKRSSRKSIQSDLNERNKRPAASNKLLVTICDNESVSNKRKIDNENLDHAPKIQA